MRVAAWNVHGFRARVDTVARAARSLQPDVLLLNEARFRWRLRRLAGDLGMSYVSGLHWPRPITNAVLVRSPWRIRSARLARLPVTGRLKPRGLLVAEIEREGARLWVAALHLGVWDPERREHAARVLALLEGVEPLILGGDLNEEVARPAAAALAGRFTDAVAIEEGTYPASRPRARIDHLFVSEGISVRRARIPAGSPFDTASDHLPVVADVEVG